MATKADFYTTLGVPKDASADDLKKAYRKMAMKYHPDRNPGDKDAEAKFKEVNEAYDILKDDQKRGAYDRFGHQAFEQGGGGFGGGGSPLRRGRSGRHLRPDVRRHHRAPRRPPALRRRPASSDRDRPRRGLRRHETSNPRAVAREVRRLQRHRLRNQGRQPQRVPHLRRRRQGPRPAGLSSSWNAPAPPAAAPGRVIKNPCRVCQGAGTVQRERTLQVAVPPGVEEGTRIRLTGEGEAGPQGTPAGDLFVHIAIKPHEIFQRDGANIYWPRSPAHDPGGAGWRGGGAGDRRHAGQGQDPRRHPDRGPVPAARQGFLRPAQRRPAATCTSRSPSRPPRHLTKRQRDILEEFEAEAKGHDKGSPEADGFFAKVAKFFEGGA